MVEVMNERWAAGAELGGLSLACINSRVVHETGFILTANFKTCY